MSENKLEQAALEYISRGWSVIPLRFTGSIEDRKKPLLQSWAEYQKRIPTEAEVRSWWRQWPSANVGVPTGAVSGLAVVDLDGPNCYELFRQQGIHLPKTIVVQTGKGFQAYYSHPGNGQAIPNRVALLKDGAGSQVDIRGDNGYVVSPPSVHGNGRVYQWAVPPIEALTPFPDEIIALLDREHDDNNHPGGEDWISQVIDGVGEGQRNDIAARLAGYFLRLNKCHEQSAYFALHTWNAQNKPPLSDTELRRTIDSVARLERRRIEQEIKTSPAYTRVEVVDGPTWADGLRDAEPRKGIAAPIPTLDELGGLVAGDVIVLAGGAGMGKSTMACRVIADVCIRQKIPTIFFSTEMGRNDVGRWVAAILEHCSVKAVPRDIPSRVLDQLRASPIKIIDAGTVRIEDIETVVRGAMGTRVVIVDHITRIATPRRESRTLEVGEVARRLKGIAKDCGLTVIELCQLNREGNDKTQPTLKALRDSGEIEQEADAVIFHWTAEQSTLGRFLPLAIYLAKNRHGAVKQVIVNWDRELKTFEARD